MLILMIAQENSFASTFTNKSLFEKTLRLIGTTEMLLNDFTGVLFKRWVTNYRLLNDLVIILRFVD